MSNPAEAAEFRLHSIIVELREALRLQRVAHAQSIDVHHAQRASDSKLQTKLKKSLDDMTESRNHAMILLEQANADVTRARDEATNLRAGVDEIRNACERVMPKECDVCESERGWL